MNAKPVAIRLDVDYGRRLLEVLARGGPINSSDPDGRWRVFDMLAVAGACLFTASSHGPALPQPDLDEGGREEEMEEHVAAVVNAADFLLRAFAALQDGRWEFGQTLAAVVRGDVVHRTPVG